MRLGLIAVAGAAAAGVAYLLDPQRRQKATSLARQAAAAAQGTVKQAQDRAQGASAQVGSQGRQEARDHDDVTLARKVESEVFRPAEMHELKGHVSVNVAEGVVELRGQVKRPDQVRALGEAAEGVAGVKGVHNLLHTAGSPPKHSPPSSPEEVRERAAEYGVGEGGGAAPAGGTPSGAGSTEPAGPTSGTPSEGVDAPLTGSVEAPVDTAQDPLLEGGDGSDTERRG